MKVLDRLFGRKPPATPPATSPARTAPAPITKNETELLIERLGRDSRFEPNPAIAELKLKGREAVPYLLDVLEGRRMRGNMPALADAIHILRDLGAKEAIPELKVLARWTDDSLTSGVGRAARAALAVLNPDVPALQLMLDKPYDHIASLWTSIIQHRQSLYPAEVLHAFCKDAIQQMNSIDFGSREKKAKAWGMMGSLYFKSIHPEWLGGFDGTSPCPEAKTCYEQALLAEPGDEWWQGWVKRFS